MIPDTTTIPTDAERTALQRAIDAGGQLVYETGGFWTVTGCERKSLGYGLAQVTYPAWWAEPDDVARMTARGWLEPVGRRVVHREVPRRVTEAGRAAAERFEEPAVGAPPAKKRRPSKWKRVKTGRDEAPEGLLRGVEWDGWLWRSPVGLYYVWVQARPRDDGVQYAGARIGANGEAEVSAEKRPAWTTTAQKWLCDMGTFMEAKQACEDDAARREGGTDV